MTDLQLFRLFDRLLRASTLLETITIEGGAVSRFASARAGVDNGVDNLRRQLEARLARPHRRGRPRRAK